MTELENKIYKIVKKEMYWGKDFSTVDKLEIDPIDALVLLIALEEEFEIELDDEVIDTWKCFNDIVYTVNGKINSK